MYKILIPFLLCFQFSFAQYPAGFLEENFGSWDLPMGVGFDHVNKMYVWERDGRVYSFADNHKNLLIDIREEVATYGDFGLLSAALDPDFEHNGYIYLYYVVDRHHLLYHGNVAYSSNSNEQGATIGRVTRFTLDPANNFASVVPNSRFVLIGETKSTGFPLTGIYHSGGDLKFAIDGSLLVSCGDGASGADYELQAYSDGIITQEEYDARRLWRCQIQNSLNGKIVRIDPSNGNGISSNPFFNPAQPRAPQSRVYAMGFRNPFRFTIKPNTGSHNLEDGNAGVLYVGDVGQDTKEEINIVTNGGQNFGWPRFEGIDHLYESNPPYHPLNSLKPAIEWGRTNSTARVVINNNVLDVGSSSFPYSNFVGGSSIGGVFYEGESYPEEYHGSYFFAEFNNQWAKSFKFDANNNPQSKVDFHPAIVGLISFAYNKFDESLYYTAVTGVVKKIKYAPSGNQAPLAKFTYNPLYGTSPLNVSFDASSSFDPENSALSYLWFFGDGTSANGINPTHQFVANNSNPQAFQVTLIVYDSQGLSSLVSHTVSVNNTPPAIISTTIDNVEVFASLGSPSVTLNAQVSDNEESNNDLTYKWEAFLYHNEHRHQELNLPSLNGIFQFGTVPCDGNSYYYRFILTVTDSYGLSTTFQKDVFPNCNPSDQVPPSIANLKAEQITSTSFQIQWNPIFDNDAVKNIELVINAQRIAYLSNSTSTYTYQSTSSILNKNFKVFVVIRDRAGNKSKSSVLDFTPNQSCVGGSFITYLSDLNEASATNGYGQFEKDKSNGEYYPNDGNTIRLNGITFSKGLGSHANSEITYNIAGLGFESFSSIVGIDDEITGNVCGTVIFKVYNDNVLVYQSPVLNQNSSPLSLNVSVLGVSELKLVLSDAGDSNCGDHGDWADAKFLKSCVSNDNSAPNIPANLSVISQPSGFLFSWHSVTDNIDSQVEYEVFLNGQYLGATFSNSFIVQTLANSNNYFTVQAKDDSGNRSVSQTYVINNCPSSLSISQAENISNQTLAKKVSQFIEAENRISNQSNVQYLAGKSILLKPGFSVSESVFVIKIQGCDN
jgi:glucose/arabinose dehydrogenase